MNIFILHGSKKMEFENDLSEALTEASLRKFFTAESIVTERWKTRIEIEVKLCDVALFVLAKGSII